MVGLRDEKSEYFLLIDDDMTVHEYVFQEMVLSIRGKKAFSTGYTVEIPDSLNFTS